MHLAWDDMIKVLGEFKPQIYHLVVKWALPSMGQQKCNTDGTSRGNPGPSSYGFYYAQAGIIGHMTNIQVDAIAILEVVRF